MRCPKHPYYSAAHYPLYECTTCTLMFLSKYENERNEMNCPDHPGYLAHDPPHRSCPICQFMWERSQRNEQILAFRFGRSLVQQATLVEKDGSLRPVNRRPKT